MKSKDWLRRGFKNFYFKINSLCYNSISKSIRFKMSSFIFPWGVYIGDLVNDTDTIPLLIDSQKGGFCLLFDEQSEAIAEDLVENIALSLVDVLPISLLKTELFTFGKKRFMHLASLQKCGIYDVAFTLNRAKTLYDTIEELILTRHHTLLSFETPTISDYNQQSSTKEPYHLVLLNLDDFPDETTSPKRIKNFLESAYDAGVYIVAFGSKDILHKPPKATKVILDKLPHITINNNNFTFDKEIFDFDKILETHSFEYLNQNKSIIVKSVLKSYEKIKEQSHEQDFLSLPIGKVGIEPYYFNFGLQSQRYSAFIAGRSGTGKSNLLNVLLTQIAQNYTAKEVELYLMDYNEGGLEFIKYKEHPNCKKLFLNMQDNTLALNMLQEFVDTMQQRAEIFTSYGVSSIDTYNKKHPNSKLPYKILIIDEVQSMFGGTYKEVDSFNKLLLDIAKKGRKFGLHFILSTQNIDSINLDKTVLSQVGLKISFRLNSEMEAMKLFNQSSAYKGATTLKKYHLLAQSDSATTIAKADYIEEDAIAPLLKELKAKRATDEILTPTVYDRADTNKEIAQQPKEPQKTHTENNQIDTKRFDTSSAKEILEKLKQVEEKSDE